MKVFVCTDHDGFYPVGVSSIVVARSEAEATLLLDAELKKRGLKDSSKFPYTFKKISVSKPNALILQDGDY